MILGNGLKLFLNKKKLLVKVSSAFIMVPRKIIPECFFYVGVIWNYIRD